MPDTHEGLNCSIMKFNVGFSALATSTFEHWMATEGYVSATEMLMLPQAAFEVKKDALVDEMRKALSSFIEGCKKQGKYFKESCPHPKKDGCPYPKKG